VRPCQENRQRRAELAKRPFEIARCGESRGKHTTCLRSRVVLSTEPHCSCFDRGSEQRDCLCRAANSYHGEGEVCSWQPVLRGYSVTTGFLELHNCLLPPFLGSENDAKIVLDGSCEWARPFLPSPIIEIDGDAGEPLGVVRPPLAMEDPTQSSDGPWS